MSKKSGFFKGVFFGAAIGAAVTLLAAPKKGSELREDAKDKYNEFKENPQGALEDLRGFSTDKFYEIKEKFDSGEYSAEKAKEYLTARRDEIKDKVDSGELSIDSVHAFFLDTRDKLAQQFSDRMTLSDEEADEESEAVSIEDKKDEDEVEDKEDLSEDYSWTQEPSTLAGEADNK